MKVYLFDDGTIESKLLKHDSERNKEIEIEVIKTEYKPADLSSYLVWVSEYGNTVHFHFCKEDFLKYDIDSQRNKIRSLYPNLSVFFAYEFLNKDVAVSKAQLAGIELEAKPEPKPEPPNKIPPKVVYDAQNVENETKSQRNKKTK